MAKYRARIVGTTNYPDDSTAGVKMEYKVEERSKKKKMNLL